MSTTTETFRPELVPTWAKVAAWLAPLTTLPSITWRMQEILGGLITGGKPCVDPATTTIADKIYLIGLLPSLQLGLALLTIGLIRPWGETFPRWLPYIGGRRVRVGFAVGVAVTGAVLLLIIGTMMVLPQYPDALWNAMGRDGPPGAKPLPVGCEPPGWEVGRWYAPMVLWPPLLLAVTVHYRRRRSAVDG